MKKERAMHYSGTAKSLLKVMKFTNTKEEDIVVDVRSVQDLKPEFWKTYKAELRSPSGVVKCSPDTMIVKGVDGTHRVYDRLKFYEKYKLSELDYIEPIAGKDTESERQSQNTRPSQNPKE